MDLLRIRTSTHHSKCTTCIKHRVIIRRTGHTMSARLAQLQLFRQHLRRQYADRQVYWKCRSLSRLGAITKVPHEITIIIDSFDQAKHSWPKSQTLQAKEFSAVHRPRLASTTIIVHGYYVLTSLSPPNVSCNSSRSAELIGYTLGRLHSLGLDLRMSHVGVQADNCSKEGKNNCCLQLLASLVATHRIRSASLSCLTSGHSHEDIDAYFSVVSNWLQRYPVLEDPDSFKQAMEEFLQQPHVREHEPHREVKIVARYRDWFLGFSPGVFCNATA